MNPSRIDELLTALKWPQIEEAKAFVDPEDTLITCAGFEDRALEFLKRCVAAGSKGFGLVGIQYLPEVAENRVRQFKELADSSSATTNGPRTCGSTSARQMESLLDQAAVVTYHILRILSDRATDRLRSTPRSDW